MAIFKANEVKRGSDAPKRVKASVRYMQHRAGKEGEKISRALFNGYGPLDRQAAYSIIDEAEWEALIPVEEPSLGKGGKAA
jgi:hypothetical protein